MNDSSALSWRDFYSETHLCRAALHLYTKAIFDWQNALVVSHDGKTLYEFARHGSKKLGRLNRILQAEKFEFRPGLAKHYRFRSKTRTIYLYPWEERIVDHLLYHGLSEILHPKMSAHSYAYRIKHHNLDLCQKHIAKALENLKGSCYVVKRDIRDFFASLSHEILLEKLKNLVPERDYLFRLLESRVRFHYFEGDEFKTAASGVPFGCSISCLLANLYLDPLDQILDRLHGIFYFRYADDILLLTKDRDLARNAMGLLDQTLHDLKLESKPSHEKNLMLSIKCGKDTPFQEFAGVDRFRHLGLEFRASGIHGLSNDKLRKVRNLFRFALKRKMRSFQRTADPHLKLKKIIGVINAVMERGVRHVAILDYYLKHTSDESQLRDLDLWLAEEVLSLLFNKGHKKGMFRKVSFKELRQSGLPSLRHRAKLIRHGKIDSPFFIWKEYQLNKRLKQRGKDIESHQIKKNTGKEQLPGQTTFSPCPKAGIVKLPVGKGNAGRWAVLKQEPAGTGSSVI